MTRRRLAALAALTPLLAAVGSCSWQEFDDIQQRAPVRAIGRPSDMSAADFPAGNDPRIATSPALAGTPILPVDQPKGHGELLVLGHGDLSLADYTFDEQGQVFSQTTPRGQFVLPPEPGTTSGVQLATFEVAAPAPSSAAGAQFVGVADHQPVLVTLPTTTTSFAVAPVGERLTLGAIAMAAGPATAAGARDLAILAGSWLYVRSIDDPTVSFECPVGSVGIALVVGEQWVAVSTAAGLRVPFAGGACVADPAVLPTSGVAGFGAALAYGDLDADGATVIVSAPLDHAIHRFRITGQTPTLLEGAGDAIPMADVTGASIHFGQTLAFGRIGGAPTLIVGDPGEAGAGGRVWLYRHDGSPRWVSIDPPSSSVLNFGSRVGVMPFIPAGRGAVDLLLASASAATSGDPGVVYLFFRVDVEDTDPRLP